jgi:hypothetical protein
MAKKDRIVTGFVKVKNKVDAYAVKMWSPLALAGVMDGTDINSLIPK